MTTLTARQQQPIRSTIPARLDRLRWTPFHTRLVLGLGTAWVLDGLSITIASSVASKLTQPDTLNLTTTQAASIGTLYLVGEVIGALVFGRLSDKLGRRKLFIWTLAIYLAGTGLTALTPKGTGWIVYLYATRIIAGLGIGGEYSAINSAIDEMMPARYRGRTDIWLNGTYWLGAILGTFTSFLLLNSLRTSEGWRIAFLAGPALAIVILYVRRNLPESPRWLVTHGREREAEEEMRQIEEIAVRDGQRLEDVPESAAITILPREAVRVPDAAAGGLPALPAAGHPRGNPDDYPVVPVQRDFLHLCPRAYEVLPRQQRRGPAVRAGVRGREPGRAAAARPSVRHPGPQEDDLWHLPGVRDAAGLQRLAVRRRRAARRGPDIRLDRRVLLCLRRGQRRLPDGQ